MSEIETATYKILGAVDMINNEGEIKGQYEVGSVVDLTLEQGTKAVEAGLAELIPEDGDETDDEDESEDEGATGATGEGDVE